MIPVDVAKILEVTSGRLIGSGLGAATGVCVDSRHAVRGSLFVALEGRRTDGHRFLRDAFERGALAALVRESWVRTSELAPSFTLIAVPDPLRAMQSFAGWYRKEYIGTVLAITGSNGKTTVKDALSCIFAGHDVGVSPGSFNSQIGVPLSVFAARPGASLSVFEVGLAEPGDMERLAPIVQPTYGILTNIGEAHLGAFESREALASAKWRLFRSLPDDGWVVMSAGTQRATEGTVRGGCCFSLGDPELVRLVGLGGNRDNTGVRMEIHEAGGHRAGFTAYVASEELLTDLWLAIAAAARVGLGIAEIAAALDGYRPPATRMEVWSTPGGVTVVNDTHSADLLSTQAAMRSCSNYATVGRRFFVFGGMELANEDPYQTLLSLGVYASDCGFTDLVLMESGGERLDAVEHGFNRHSPEQRVSKVTDDAMLIEKLVAEASPGDVVLFKSSRNSGLGRVAQNLVGSMANRCFWIDLEVVAENIAKLRRLCRGARVMPVVKALGYGTEIGRFASWLSEIGINDLCVSAASEGAAIRRAGAKQNILVLLPTGSDAGEIARYRLTPVVYSERLIEVFESEFRGSGASINVHLKVDTGMHRMGVPAEDAVRVAKKIAATRSMTLTGVCTHFASADAPVEDDFTLAQKLVFDRVVDELVSSGFPSLVRHAANSAATLRFPGAVYDMVRVGLALYGVYPSSEIVGLGDLQLAIALTSRISDIRKMKSGMWIGYNRTHRLRRDSVLASIPFGYNDGMPWSLSGKALVVVRGEFVPVVGRVSMDQMVLDITDLPTAREGDEVLLYGCRHGHIVRPEHVADTAGTIAHELLTRVGDRVKRVFLEP